MPMLDERIARINRHDDGVISHGGTGYHDALELILDLAAERERLLDILESPDYRNDEARCEAIRAALLHPRSRKFFFSPD